MTKPLIERYFEQLCRDLGFQEITRLEDPRSRSWCLLVKRKGERFEFRFNDSVDAMTTSFPKWLRQIAHRQDKDPIPILEQANGL